MPTAKHTNSLQDSRESSNQGTTVEEAAAWQVSFCAEKVQLLQPGIVQK